MEMNLSVRYVSIIILMFTLACQPVSTSTEEENISITEREIVPEEEENEESLDTDYDLEVIDKSLDVEICSGGLPTDDPVTDLTGFNISDRDGFISLNVNLVQGIDSDPPLDIFIEFENDGIPTAEPGGGKRTILVHFFSVVFSGGWLDALTGETDNTAMTISWFRSTGILNIEFPREYLGAGEMAISVSSIHLLSENTCDNTETGLFSLN